MKRVLLVSPRLPAGHPSYCGDHAYTDLMLEYPPDGVEYYHYHDLMREGRGRHMKWRLASSYYLSRLGVLPPDTWLEAFESSFKPDLVHIYGYSAAVKLTSAPHVPLILGAGTGSYSDLKYYLGWRVPRIMRARRRKQLFLRSIGAHDASLRPDKAARVLVWSEFSRRMHEDEGVSHDNIQVLSPGLPSPRNVRVGLASQNQTTFLFVGGAFERKNGPMLVRAFQRLQSTNPDARLIMVGRPNDGRVLDEKGITHFLSLSRQELLENIYPKADVLVLPSRAEGFGLVILEAMSFGIPVIATNAFAMPEIVKHGETGFLIEPDSLPSLVASMRRLATDSQLVAAMQSNCRRVFETRFSIEAHNQKLGAIYDEVLCARHDAPYAQSRLCRPVKQEPT